MLLSCSSPSVDLHPFRNCAAFSRDHLGEIFTKHMETLGCQTPDSMLLDSAWGRENSCDILLNMICFISTLDNFYFNKMLNVISNNLDNLITALCLYPPFFVPVSVMLCSSFWFFFGLNGRFYMILFFFLFLASQLYFPKRCFQCFPRVCKIQFAFSSWSLSSKIILLMLTMRWLVKVSGSPTF